MAINIQLRRGTAAEWTASHAVLAAGEPGLETDTLLVKYGDGSSPWEDLDYSQGGTGADGSPGVDGNTTVLLEVGQALPVAGTHAPGTLYFRKQG